MGVFARMMSGLAAEADAPKTLMIDATYLKAHRTASSPRLNRRCGAPSGRHRTHKGWPQHQAPRLHRRRREALRFILSAGQVGDHTGALALLSTLPPADWLLADRGRDASWFRGALLDKEAKPCIPSRSSRGKAIKHDNRRCKRRHRIEMMFGQLKDWRRVATRLTTAARSSSSRPSRSPPRSCSGYES